MILRDFYLPIWVEGGKIQTESRKTLNDANMMIVKPNIHEDGRLFLAICDKNILGKKFEENDLQIDLSSSFFKGEEKNEEEIIKLIKNACMVNFAGKESVELAIKEGLVDKDKIITIKNIPTAQMLRI